MTLLNALRSSLSWLWQNKGKIGLSVLSTLVFAVLLFPFNDLSDFISRQVSVATRNSVFLQMGGLDLSFFPQFGAQAQQVYVEAAFLPGLRIEELTITPSLRSAISQKPYGSLSAKGVFQGDVNARLGAGGTSERGNPLQQLDITAKRLNLQDLRAIANLPLVIKGRLEAQTSGKIDLNWAEQPDLEINFKIDQLELPPSTVNLGMMGDLSLPEMRVSSVEFKGKLSNGRLTIENMRVGNQPQDDLLGSVKGSLTMNMRGPMMDLGAYTFDVDVRPSPEFRERAKFFLEFIAGYQQGDRYRMKISGSRFGAPPAMAPLR